MKPQVRRFLARTRAKKRQKPLNEFEITRKSIDASRRLDDPTHDTPTRKRVFSVDLGRWLTRLVFPLYPLICTLSALLADQPTLTETSNVGTDRSLSYQVLEQRLQRRHRSVLTSPPPRHRLVFRFCFAESRVSIADFNSVLVTVCRARYATCKD